MPYPWGINYPPRYWYCIPGIYSHFLLTLIILIVFFILI